MRLTSSLLGSPNYGASRIVSTVDGHRATCPFSLLEYRSSNNFYLNAEIKSESDLLPPGAAPGTLPTDVEQATGLERLELLGKMQGIDIFDMKPLDASRKGTCCAIYTYDIIGVRVSELVG